MKKLLVVGFAVAVCIIACLMFKNDLSALACGYSISIDPPVYDFGTQPMLSSSVPQEFVITNTSSCGEELTGLFVGKIGADSKHFKIVSNNCGTTLGDGAICTVEVVFSPKAVDIIDDASLWVAATGPEDVENTSDLSGEGTDAEPGSLLMLSQLGSQGDSDGCNATASTGAAGKTSSGPAALGLVALMGLVLGTATLRRRLRKRS